MKKKKRKPGGGRKTNWPRVNAMKTLRDRGWTWERIGARFGVTRMAASQAVKRHFPE